MKKVEHMDSELVTLGADTLRSVSRQSPFLLPDGYFDTLPDHIAALIQYAEAAEPQPQWSRQLPFEAPAPAYFEDFNSRIVALAAHEEQPILEGLSKALPFSAVPDGYFEQFPNDLIRTLQHDAQVQQPAARPKRVTLFHGWQLAASVALIIFTGLGILRLNTGSTKMAVSTTAKNQLPNFTGISKDAITDYINQNIDEFDTELIVSSFTESGTSITPELNVSKTEIEKYLDEDGWN